MDLKLPTLDQHEQPCLPFLGETEDDFLSPPERLGIMRTGYSKYVRQICDDSISFVVKTWPTREFDFIAGVKAAREKWDIKALGFEFQEIRLATLQDRLLKQMVSFSYSSGWATCERHSRIIDLIGEGSEGPAEQINGRSSEVPAGLKDVLQNSIDQYDAADAEGEAEEWATAMEEQWGLESWDLEPSGSIDAGWTALRLRAGGLLAVSAIDALTRLPDEESDWAKAKRNQLIDYVERSE
jgi:hypothetical protein